MSAWLHFSVFCPCGYFFITSRSSGRLSTFHFCREAVRSPAGASVRRSAAVRGGLRRFAAVRGGLRCHPLTRLLDTPASVRLLLVASRASCAFPGSCPVELCLVASWIFWLDYVRTLCFPAGGPGIEMQPRDQAAGTLSRPLGRADATRLVADERGGGPVPPAAQTLTPTTAFPPRVGISPARGPALLRPGGGRQRPAPCRCPRPPGPLRRNRRTPGEKGMRMGPGLSGSGNQESPG